MNKWLVLAVAFVFGVPFQAYCDNHSEVLSGGEIVVAQITQPPTGTVRTPTPPRPPAVNTPPAGTAIQANVSQAAAKQMLNLSAEMDHECKLYERELYKILSDPTMMKNQWVKAKIIEIQSSIPCGNLTKFRQNTYDLNLRIQQALSQGLPQTQGTPSPGTLQKGGPATLPKGGPAK